MTGNILLVEDEKSLNRAVGLKLSKEGYMIYPAESIGQAKQFFESKDIQLVICDIGLPDGSGLELCESIRARERAEGRDKGVIFLFLTAMDTEEDMVMGYAAGGDDYITKPFSLSVLVSKVNAIMGRYAVTGRRGSREQEKAGDASQPASNTIRCGDIIMDTEKNRASKGGEFLSLTANEQKLLTFFMENPMKVLSKKQLLEAIWDIDGNFVDDNTVAVNIRRLREKIEDDPSSPAFIKNIRGLGYIWERECEKL